MHYYDTYGWLTQEPIAGRETDVAPPQETGGLRANWTGEQWVLRVYEAPAQSAPTPEPRRITRLAFRNRFTQTEKVTLEIASLDDPMAPMSQRQMAAAIRVHLADVSASTFIDLGRADTRSGVQMLEAAGLLAAGRALAILDAPVTPEEAPL